jgi:S1-C subfamily serine protease
MVLGDYYLVTFSGSSRRKLTGSIYAVEPANDIAVIAQPDNHAFYDKAEAFDDFIESVSPIPISDGELRVGEPFPISVFTHKRTWIRGKATCYDQFARGLVIETNEPIRGGTSGSPVVDASGCVVGVVSNSSRINGKDTCRGFCARPSSALPVWVWRQIAEAQKS